MRNRKFKLLKQLKEAISMDPRLVPEVLDAVKGGMDNWQLGVERRLDSNANMGINSALQLPRNSRDWKTERHGDTARMVYVGWNLHSRPPGSSLELDIVGFVQKADEENPEEAEAHYEVLLRKD